MDIVVVLDLLALFHDSFMLLALLHVSDSNLLGR
jgi:hypothetical protein